MKYKIVRDVIDLLEEFESENSCSHTFSADIDGFKRWVSERHSLDTDFHEPEWDGKEHGRSSESVISTLIVHMNRYAKSYSKAAIYGSEFSTQEDFIYLINLHAFGEMSKMDLIKKNVHEKPTGMQVINRLLAKGWIEQSDSLTDKRSKMIRINQMGQAALDKQMKKIRKATNIVAGNLGERDKLELIRLLTLLDDFHRPIYASQIESQNLLEHAMKSKPLNP